MAQGTDCGGTFLRLYLLSLSNSNPPECLLSLFFWGVVCFCLFVWRDLNGSPGPAGLGLQGIRKSTLSRKELLGRLCQAQGYLNEARLSGMTREGLLTLSPPMEWEVKGSQPSPTPFQRVPE